MPDLAPEQDETVLLRLSAPTGATVATGQGTGTIRDDDVGPPPPPILPTVAIADTSVAEGDSGTVAAAFTVTLSKASTSAVTVAFATRDGTATAGSDYVAASGTITFAPGQTTRTIVVSVRGDTLHEPDETFAVNLATPSGATLARAAATGTIRDDDPAAPPPSQPAIGFAVRDNWGSGFVADLLVRNTGTTAITDWTLSFDASFAITNIWNATIVSKVGTRYTIRAMSYNGQIAPGGSAGFGFQAGGAPGAGLSNVTLNGQPVTVGVSHRQGGLPAAQRRSAPTRIGAAAPRAAHAA